MHRRESELCDGARIFMKQKLEKVLFANMSIHTPFKDSKKTNVSGERNHRKVERMRGVETELYHCVIVNRDCALISRPPRPE